MRQFRGFRDAAGGTLFLWSFFLGVFVAGFGHRVLADGHQVKEPVAGIPLPTGKMITPTAASGAIFQDLDPRIRSAPDLRAGQAVAVSIAPDGKMLAILTSGYNQRFGQDGKPIAELSTEYVFLFDISGAQPKQLQVLQVANTFLGLAWAPSSNKIYISGGKDDVVLEFVRNGSTFAAGRSFPLGHQAGVGLHLESRTLKSRADAKPMVAALAVSPDGTRLLVANFQNDSASLIELKTGKVVAEQDLRPGVIDPRRHGQPGGSFPRCVAWTSPSHAYIGSERDREIISLAITGPKIRVVRRMPVHGQPVALLANREGSRIYAALDNTDQVAIFDTARDALIEEFNVAAPQAVYPNLKKLGGANSNALALTPDGDTLLVSNGGENAIAVVRLSNDGRGLSADQRKIRGGGDGDDPGDQLGYSRVIGLVPTGWYPTGVATSKDGRTWYVVNAKSETGPNASWCHELNAQNTCIAKNPSHQLAENGALMLRIEGQVNSQLEKAGFLTIPAPPALELARLTKQVARNDHFDKPAIAAKDEELFSFLRAHIHHVIYIIKENRTYDQVLGDLEIGNGDPRLTIFPEKISPNHHAIARSFVTLDNFLVDGEGSWTGWDWSTAARTNDFREREEPIAGANRGLNPDMAGVNRNINMGFATNAERKIEFRLAPSDPDILPGARDISALDGPGGEEGRGYIWDAALRHGLTVRNYGVYENGTPELFIDPSMVPLVRQPFAEKLKVFFPAMPSLMPFTDQYYHGWNPAFPDYWRYREWKREFDAFSAAKVAPNLMLVELGEDHLGSFDKAIDGVNTPETQMADNDYALGLILEAVANSPFANDTLIVAVEDDAWDGPDHADAFRTVALLAGPYVRQHVLVSTRYSTVSLVKTIEEILGTESVGLNDALAAPMSDVFDPSFNTWSYKAIVPDVLRTTQLPLLPQADACNAIPRRSAAYWAKAMAGQDFSGMDRANPVTFNRALWRGLEGDTPYPSKQTGADLRANRKRLLTSWAGVSSDAKHCALPSGLQ